MYTTNSITCSGQTNRETDKPTDRTTDRQTDIATYRAAIVAKKIIKIIDDITYNNIHKHKNNIIAKCNLLLTDTLNCRAATAAKMLNMTT